MQLSPLMNLNIPATFLSPSLLLTRACSEVALAFSLDQRLARPHAPPPRRCARPAFAAHNARLRACCAPVASLPRPHEPQQ